MTVESVTYISDLNASYPASGDSLVEGDDHIRNTKTAIKATFPNVSGAVTPTHTELNYVDGVTSAIQTQLDAKATPANLGLRYLSGQDASASATIDFTTGIDSTYEEYELHLINVVPANGAGAIGWLRTTEDGVTWNSTAGDYDYALITNVTLDSGGATETKIVLSGTVSSTASDGGLSMVIRIFNPAGTTHIKQISATGTALITANPATIAVAGVRAATAAITGVRFLFSTGNITSGKFKLYGVRKS